MATWPAGPAEAREAALRNAIVRPSAEGMAAAFARGTPAFTSGCRCPRAARMNALVTQAAQAGITLAPPGSLQRMPTEQLGIRLCLGAPATEEDLERALIEIRRILEMAEAISFV